MPRDERGKVFVPSRLPFPACEGSWASFHHGGTCHGRKLGAKKGQHNSSACGLLDLSDTFLVRCRHDGETRGDLLAGWKDAAPPCHRCPHPWQRAPHQHVRPHLKVWLGRLLRMHRTDEFFLSLRDVTILIASQATMQAGNS